MNDKLSNGMLLAERAAKRYNLELREVFAYQFVAGPGTERQLSGFSEVKFADWTVSIGPKLDHCILKDNTGRMAGLFLGLGVDENGALVDIDFIADLVSTGPEFLCECERRIEKTAGRFAVFLDTPSGPRLYFDPAGTLSIVYDPATRIIASSLTLCLEREIVPNPPFDIDTVLAGKGVFALSNTADVAVKVIKANHFLDLNSFRLVRHWPKLDDLSTHIDLSFAEKTDFIADRLSQIVTALTEARTCIMPLSGGRDSRLMAALSKTALGKVKYTYAHAFNMMSRVDAELGKVVAQTLGVPFEHHDANSEGYVTPKRFHRSQRVRSFFLGSGYFAKPRPPTVNGLQAMLPKDAVLLRGGLIDLVRAVWWRGWPTRRKIADTGLETEMANVFLGCADQYSGRPELERSYLEWRAGLDDSALPLIHDFIFLELFYPSSWQGYNGIQDQFFMCPCADRGIISMLLSFPIEDRFHLRAFTAMLEHQAPELTSLPTHFEYRTGRRSLN